MRPLLTDGKLTVELNATELKKLSGTAEILSTLAELGIMGAVDAINRLDDIIDMAKAGPLCRAEPTAEK